MDPILTCADKALRGIESVRRETPGGDSSAQGAHEVETGDEW